MGNPGPFTVARLLNIVVGLTNDLCVFQWRITQTRRYATALSNFFSLKVSALENISHHNCLLCAHFIIAGKNCTVSTTNLYPLPFTKYTHGKPQCSLPFQVHTSNLQEKTYTETQNRLKERNKKVLLSERKRHTDCGVSSTPYAVLSR